ncbi:hypothetical protein MAR_003972 [Mya arenaria]|uniref:Uncharacterized protein n=1 Tax=Mya arenaria TaxID=6604 RepID=A0ABY7EV88_MYAAR|nr:hypothetical protein MAR_003972 [Mya arenaria]
MSLVRMNTPLMTHHAHTRKLERPESCVIVSIRRRQFIVKKLMSVPLNL